MNPPLRTGLQSKMGYIGELGAKVIWMSDIFKTDGSEMGIIDHMATSDVFGANTDQLRQWMKELEKEGIRKFCLLMCVVIYDNEHVRFFLSFFFSILEVIAYQIIQKHHSLVTQSHVFYDSFSYKGAFTNDVFQNLAKITSI